MIIIIPAAALLIWILIENRLLLLVRRDKLTDREDSIRAVQISDLHRRRFGKDQCRITRLTAAQKPDIIFVTGDLVSRKETEFSEKQRFLRELCRIAPVYMIYGNHEQSLREEYRSVFLRTVEDTDVILLRNESRTADIRGRKIRIYGFESDYSVYKKPEQKHPYRDLSTVSGKDVEKELGKASAEGDVILLSHNPLFASSYAEWGADITFSGHVHGGVVRLFGKGMLSPERRFLPEYTKGVYRIGDMKLCVSAGLGKLRLFDPPEINVYDL
ncbi:MAG: metallophosphoesterase [Ruminococcus sp.]|nr:metallophosphoesterase [Ruminococcus sp.]